MKKAQPKKAVGKKAGATKTGVSKAGAAKKSAVKTSAPSKANKVAPAGRKATPAKSMVGRGKATPAKRDASGKRKGVPLSSSVAPGRKFVKRSGAVLAQPRTPKASIRTPAGAEELKARIGALSKAVSEIRGLKRSLVDSFWSVGEALAAVDVDRLYEVKGYVSLDSFIDRELGMSKRIGTSLRLMPELLQRPAAESAGLDRSVAAVEALVGKPNS